MCLYAILQVIACWGALNIWDTSRNTQIDQFISSKIGMRPYICLNDISYIIIISYSLAREMCYEICFI